MNLVLNVHVNANDLTPNTIDYIKQLQAMEQEGAKGAVKVTQHFSKPQERPSEQIQKEVKENRNEPQNLPEDTDIRESFTLEEVQKALIELAHKKGKEVSKEVVKSFGAESATTLPPEVYPNVMEAIGKVMGDA